MNCTPFWKEITAAAAGFLVASAIPAAIFSTLWPLDETHRIGSIASSFVVAYPFSAAATILLGLPTFLLLRPFRPGQWWSVLAAGFLLGTIASILIRLPGQPDLADVLKNGPTGAVTALVFWLIWKRHAGKGHTH